jgi:hypothetical protein
MHDLEGTVAHMNKITGAMPTTEPSIPTAEDWWNMILARGKGDDTLYQPAHEHGMRDAVKWFYQHYPAITRGEMAERLRAAERDRERLRAGIRECMNIVHQSPSLHTLMEAGGILRSLLSEVTP